MHSFPNRIPWKSVLLLFCVSALLGPAAQAQSGTAPEIANKQPELAESSAPLAAGATAIDAPSAGDDQSSSSSDTPTAPAPAKPALDMGFFHRLGRAYVADWSGNSPGNPVIPTRRGTPAPISSPPFPSSDWPIGGTPLIGAPDTQTYVLMQAINQNKDVNKMYGWISIGANGSTNNKGHAPGVPANWPSAYDEYPNTVVLDQIALYFERLPDTVQTKHFDWGYRLTGLYGQDYRFTTAKGMLSQQLLVKNAQYGFDPVMAYVDLYIPHVKEGLNI